MGIMSLEINIVISIRGSAGRGPVIHCEETNLGTRIANIGSMRTGKKERWKKPQRGAPTLRNVACVKEKKIGGGMSVGNRYA